MVEAKTPRRKAFWVSLIVVSMSMTIISISRSMDNFFEEPSHVVAEHLEIEEMLYPPLKVCLGDWIYWTNWTRVREMSFSKAELLYAISLLQEVYSEEYFDADQVEKAFFKKLAAHNMSLIERFNESITIRPSKVLENLEGEAVEYNVIFNNIETNRSLIPRYMMCLSFSEDQIKANIRQTLSDSQSDTMPFDSNIFILFSSTLWAPNETHWIREKERLWRNNPLWIFFNSYIDNGHVIRGDAKYITISAHVRHWKNTAENPCRENCDWIEGNATCFDVCREKFHPFTKDDLRRNCTKEILTPAKNTVIKFIGSESKEESNTLEENESLFFNSICPIQITTTKREELENLYDECVKSCNEEVGCRVWTYDVRHTELPHYEELETRTLMLVYPSSVEAVKEINLQTWENFISSIGGLLGIWTGASILTILQIVYLLLSDELKLANQLMYGIL